MIDCHWHPTSYDENEMNKKISKAREEGINKIIGVPLDLKTSENLLRITRENKELYPSVGIHPHSAIKSSEEEVRKVCNLLEKEKVTAAGEIGIDLHFLNEDTTEQQLNVFRKILNKASNKNLPIILHCPRGEPLTYKEVNRTNAKNVIFHWYTGPHEILRKILDTAGYYVSITPAITYSGKLQKIVELSNIDSVLVESDGPTEYRSLGKGEPTHVLTVVKKIAEIKNIDEKTVERVTTNNAEEVFDI